MTRPRLATLLIAVFLVALAIPILRGWLHKRHLAQQEFTTARLVHELDSGRPVLVSIYARWDTNTFDQLHRMSDRVPRLLQEQGIALLRADWTEYSGDTDKLMARLGLRAVPAFVIFTPENRANPTVLPNLTSEDALVTRVESLRSRE